MAIVIQPANEFHDGWLRYVLGLPRPPGVAAADGWDMAAETAPLYTMRAVFTHPNVHRSYTVQIVDDADAAVM